MAAAVGLFEKIALFPSVAARPPNEIIKPHGSRISADTLIFKIYPILLRNSHDFLSLQDSMHNDRATFHVDALYEPVNSVWQLHDCRNTAS